jgi:hypothetical protein
LANQRTSLLDLDAALFDTPRQDWHNGQVRRRQVVGRRASFG